MAEPVTIGNVVCGSGQPLVWIAGPCVIESHELTLRIAETLRGLADRLGLPLIFKASFDKANRTSGKSFRGPGLQDGLRTLETVKRRTGLPVTTDIHESQQVAAGGRGVRPAADPSVPGPADRSAAGGRPAPGRAVNVKKGQFMAPWDMRHVVAKMAEVGQSPAAADRAGRLLRLWPAGQRHAVHPVDAGSGLPGDL